MSYGMKNKYNLLGSVAMILPSDKLEVVKTEE
jgi:hypothetical protein